MTRISTGAPHSVRAFVEKPDIERAMRYVQSGEYLWNAGIFFFTPRTLLDEIARQRPQMAALCDRIAASLGTPAQDEVIAEAFDQFEAISIDYAVMEGAPTLRVIPAEFPWSDVGHWAALPEICAPDEQGNVVEGAREAIVRETTNAIIYTSEPKLVAALGVHDLVVVDTPDALLIVDRARAQEVRGIVTALDERDDPLPIGHALPSQ